MIFASCSTEGSMDLTIPGPRMPRPNMGVFGDKASVMRFYRDPIRAMTDFAMLGPVVEWSSGPPRRIFVFGGSYNQQLLTDPDHFHAFILATPAKAGSSLHRLGATGLLAMNGEPHRRQRRRMMPVFHKKAVESYRDAMVELTERFVERWRFGQSLDLAHEMRQLTLAISSTILFGLDERPSDVGIGQLIRQWLELASSMPTVLFPVDWPATPYRRLLRLSERIEATLRAIIQEKRVSPDRHADVLTMLMQARDEDGGQMTDDDLVGQTAQLFAAGYETSANALTWTLFLLDQHPAILADVRDELDAVLHGAAPAVEQMNSLPLLDRVIKESLRILPPATYGARTAMVPTLIDQYPIVPGTRIYFSHYITHRLPELYPDPACFRPDRWLTIDPSPYDYLPFSAGPRMCLGVAFATLEIKIVLAILLQRYRLAIPDGTSIDPQVRVTLSPKRGLPVRVIPPQQPLGRGQVHGSIRTMLAL